MKKILLYGNAESITKKLIELFEFNHIDVHLVSNSELEDTLMNVLEKSTSRIFETPKYNMTLCLFSGKEREEVFLMIDKTKELKIKRPVFAIETKININWKIGKILVDANQDHIEMNKKDKLWKK